jgi:prepilin-type processing-associated H-X9-DG protein
MKVSFSKQRIGGSIRSDVLVAILLVFLLFMLLVAMVLPVHEAARRNDKQMFCVANLKQMNLAFRIWEGDNNNQFPMTISATHGGAMESIQLGNLGPVFEVMSNELITPRILACPADPDCTFATNWTQLDASHISYFVNPDVTNEEYPQMVLDGDDNLIIAGKPVKSGVLAFSSNSPIAWSEKRHRSLGNLGFADGSVQEESQNGLQEAFEPNGMQPFQQAGLATNRIAIP